MVVASLLVIFIKLADVTFGNKVSFLGATLSIGKPELIYQGILLFLAYSVWRFYQYFSTDKAYAALRSQYREHMEGRTSVKIVQLICKPTRLQGLSGEYSYKKLTRVGLFTYSVEAAVPGEYDPTNDETLNDRFSANISAIKLEAYRLLSIIVFIFRGRILTDYFVPYLVLAYAVLLQYV
jgi:hypothetical protein